MSITIKPQNPKLAATKRIMRDLRDLDKTPVPGLGVCCPDESNPFVLHCNVLINDGPYSGILIHLVLHIPDDYPLTGPAGNIAPGLEFNSMHHGHIHEDYINGHALCNDMLTNYSHYFSHIDQGRMKQSSGWSPGYTLSTALLQIITFFSDPDLSKEPSAEIIADLRRTVENFTCSTCGHCNIKPNPSVVPYVETMSDEKVRQEEEKEAQLKLECDLKEKLTCGITKQNVLDDKICLGYPLMVVRDHRGRFDPEIVLELISYDAYVAEIQKSGGEKLDFYEKLKFRSVTGSDYNHWLPIYINPTHFQQGRQIIENSISIIANGTASGAEKYAFQPLMALNVLITLLNKCAVRLFNGQLFQSTHAIEAYCHFLRLLMHFIEIFPELGWRKISIYLFVNIASFFFLTDTHINLTVEKFVSKFHHRHKKVVPDIGEFLIKVALSTKYELKNIKECIYEEYFARQIYWLQQTYASGNISNIRVEDLPTIFQRTKISNHLLVFNFEMAETFIFDGVKEKLDKLHGYPPTAVVEKFQQRLKAIKAIDRYSVFMQAIRMSDKIKTPDNMFAMIKRSIRISNEQHYTNVELSSR
ncbi:unnamed protein product [Adineta steineri]|uniref:UBC core domain-containing protein n=1 Tax=Adineta steineri TaxID=433720 RepID=A0A814EME2_9BILA|nr:unnamed protein product [Adineta steineri]CAF0968187.1 unnamed protein product [Adineta steineri]